MESSQYIITYKLDTRRVKAKGLYPVKLNVYSIASQKQKYYNTQFNFTEKDFQSIWETVKPRSEFIEKRLEMQFVLGEANAVARKITRFSFDQFEKKYFRNKGDGKNVFYHYNLIIDKLDKEKRFGTKSNYELSMKSIKGFLANVKGREVDQLSFSEITADMLGEYESYMLNTIKRSRTTVAIYLRPLRAVFNAAIEAKEIEKDCYPFGRLRYKIPVVRKVKKALNSESLKTLYEGAALTPEQQKARDFWFFIYSCNGMNVRDIAQLRWKDMEDDRFTFYRAKTINTASVLVPVTVYLNDFTKLVIAKYANKCTDKDQLLFPIISDSDSEFEKFKKIQNFTKYINQHIKKLAASHGLPAGISPIWARHSFATNAIRKGASMEYVSEALSHSNLKTTQGYFAGFEDKDKQALMQNFMNF